MLFRSACAVSMIVGCVLAACGSDSGSSSGGDGASSGGAPPPANGTFAVDFGSTTLLAAHENGALAALPDGEVIFAARSGDGSSAGGILAARLGPAGEARWVKSFTLPAGSSTNLPAHIVIAGTHAYVLSAPQGTDALHIIDVNVDSGIVNRARAFKGSCAYPVRGRALADGGLVVSCSGDYATFVRLDESLTVKWSRTGRGGGDVAVLADGFAFGGVSSSLTPVNPGQAGGAQVGTGASVHFIDENGTSRGWYFMGPGPGTHSVAGVRAMPDGRVLVAIGVDSTRSDSPAALSPLVLATFGSDGSPVKMQRANLNVEASTGSSTVPLQFGGGRTMIARSDETWIGFVANSGGIGSDIRGSVVARFGLDGTAKDAVLGGIVVAPTTGGAALGFSLVSGRLSLSRSAPDDQTCVKRPTLIVTDIAPYLDKKTAMESATVEATLTATDLMLTATDVTAATTSICQK